MELKIRLQGQFKNTAQPMVGADNGPKISVGQAAARDIY
jgi:hypothetical protein